MHRVRYLAERVRSLLRRAEPRAELPPDEHLLRAELPPDEHLLHRREPRALPPDPQEEEEEPYSPPRYYPVYCAYDDDLPQELFVSTCTCTVSQHFLLILV